MKRLIIIMPLLLSVLMGQDTVPVETDDVIEVTSMEDGGPMGMFENPNSWGNFLKQNLRSLLWAITAAIGFGLGVGISLKVFDWLSTDIDEWEEIKKGNMGVSLIFVSLIVMVGLIVYKVI